MASTPAASPKRSAFSVATAAPGETDEDDVAAGDADPPPVVVVCWPPWVRVPPLAVVWWPPPTTVVADVETVTVVEAEPVADALAVPFIAIVDDAMEEEAPAEPDVPLVEEDAATEDEAVGDADGVFDIGAGPPAPLMP